MVRQILRTFASPVRGLHEAAYLLAGLTLASQALALLRDRLFAHHFGAGATLDLYYAAFKVPDLVFALVASLVSAYVLIPRIAGAEPAATRRLISETASFLLFAGGALVLVLGIFAPQLLFGLFPAFKGTAQAGDFIMLSRLLLIQPILLGLSSIAMSVTQVERRFALFALSPVLYNLGIIGGIVLLYPSFGLTGIGIGVIAGAVAHSALHLPVLARAGVFPCLVWPRARELWPIMRESMPRSLALGMGALATLGLTSFAARAGTGGISIFALAGNLEAVPLSLIGASYATAAFPVLAEHASAKRHDAFVATLSAAGRHLIFWSVVVAALSVVLRAHIVRVVLGSGAFDWNATRLTAAVLAVLVVGLVAQGIVLLASRAFYAARRSWNPLIIQVAGAAASLGSAALLLSLSARHPMLQYFVEALFRIPDVPGSAILLVAIGSTIGQLFMMLLALITLGTVAPGVARGYARPLLEAAGAAILGSAAAYGVLAALGNLAPLTTLATVFTEAALAGMVGLVVAGAVLALLENKEFQDLRAALSHLRSRMLPPLSEF